MKVLVVTNMYPTKRLPRGTFVKTQVEALRSLASVRLVAERGEQGDFLVILWKYVRIAAATIWATVTGSADVVHAHYVFPTGFIALVPKFLRGSKLVVTSHAGDIFNMPRRSAVHHYLTGFVLRHADHIIAVSEELRSIIVSEFGVKDELVSVIDMGVDLSLFHPGNRFERQDSGEKVPRKIKIMSVCTEFQRKGGPDLLRALCEAPAGTFSGVELDLFTADTGEYSDYLRRHGAEETVHFRGLHPPAAIAESLRNSDIFVLASYSEGLPIALLEAMASGCAVVASDVGGTPAVLQDGENGFMISPGDIESLRSSLKRLADDPSLRRRLGASALESVREFDAVKRAAQVFAIYKRVLEVG